MRLLHDRKDETSAFHVANESLKELAMMSRCLADSSMFEQQQPWMYVRLSTMESL